MDIIGNIEKMITHLDDTVQYQLPIGDQHVDMNRLIGKTVSLTHTGTINCVACGRNTKKSFNQGFCYPCFQGLAQCDSCIIKPELCHFAEGTCREADWGLKHCFIDHYVYLANSSGVKVGITRGTQIPTRWMDQGASQALPVFKVKDRLTSGLVEVMFKNHVADKTSWQRMLKGEPDAVNLVEKRDELFNTCKTQLAELTKKLGDDAVMPLYEEPVVDIRYPVHEYPIKVKSFNFDKTPEVTGKLLGIKGQYLILDAGVLNVRKFGGYEIELVV